jgi:hypothetical protein
MRRVRARLTEWSVLALALFASSVATPRAGLYFHHHAGGDHLHVHLDDGDHDHDHDATEQQHHDHHHHGHLAQAAANSPAIAVPDGDGTGHWHSREVFHRAVAPALFTGHYRETVHVAPSLPEPAAVDRPALPIRVRGPPRPA